MRVPSLTVDMLAAVVALAQKGNLEPAGKELGLSPSAVHKRIKAANQVFGTRLFIGTNDGFELTEVGRTLYSHATLPIEQVLLAEETTRQVLIEKESHAGFMPPSLGQVPEAFSGDLEADSCEREWRQMPNQGR